MASYPCLLFLSMMYSQWSYVVSGTSPSSLVMAKQCSIVRMHHILFHHLLVDGYLACLGLVWIMLLWIFLWVLYNGNTLSVWWFNVIVSLSYLNINLWVKKSLDSASYLLGVQWFCICWVDKWKTRVWFQFTQMETERMMKWLVQVT